MSVRLARGEGVEVISLEQMLTVSKQGKPSYDSPIDLDARVVREDALVKLGNGSEVRTTVTLWLEGSQTPLPRNQDRITTADGLVGIVVEVLQRKRLDGSLDHVRARLREQ